MKPLLTRPLRRAATHASGLPYHRYRRRIMQKLY